MQNLNSRNNYITNKFQNNQKIIEWLQNNSKYNPYFNGWQSSLTPSDNIFDVNQQLPQIISGANNTFTITFKKPSTITDTWFKKNDDSNNTIYQLNSPSGMWPYNAQNSITFTNVNLPFGAWTLKFTIGGKTYTLPGIIQTTINIVSVTASQQTSGTAVTFTVNFSAPTNNIAEASIFNTIDTELYTLNFTKSSTLTSSTFITIAPVNTGIYNLAVKDTQDNVYTNSTPIVVTPQVLSITDAVYESSSFNKLLTFTLASTGEIIKSIRIKSDTSNFIDLESNQFTLPTAVFSKNYTSIYPINELYRIHITFKNNQTYVGGRFGIKNFGVDNLPANTFKLVGETLPFNIYINPTAELTDLYLISTITGIKKNIPFTPIPSTVLHQINYSLVNNLVDDGCNLWKFVAKTRAYTYEPNNIYKFGFNIVSYAPLSFERINTQVTLTVVIDCEINPARDIKEIFLIDYLGGGPKYPLAISSISSNNPNSPNRTLNLTPFNGNTIPVGEYILMIKDRTDLTFTVSNSPNIQVVDQFFNILTMQTFSSTTNYPLIVPMNIPLTVYFSMNRSVIVSIAQLVNTETNDTINLTNVATTESTACTGSVTVGTFGKYRLRITTSTGLVTTSNEFIYGTFMAINPVNPFQTSGTSYSSIDVKISDGVVLADLNPTVVLSYDTNPTNPINATPTQIVSLGVVRITFTSPITPLGTSKLIFLNFKDRFNNNIIDLSILQIQFNQPASILPFMYLNQSNPYEIISFFISDPIGITEDNTRSFIKSYFYSQANQYFDTTGNTSRIYSRLKAVQFKPEHINKTQTYGVGSFVLYKKYNTSNQFYKSIFESIGNGAQFGAGTRAIQHKWGFFACLYRGTVDEYSITAADSMSTPAQTSSLNSMDWSIELTTLAILKKPTSTFNFNFTLTGAETTAGVNQFDIFDYRNSICFARGIDLLLHETGGNTASTASYTNLIDLALHPNGNVSIKYLRQGDLDNNPNNEYVILPIVYNTRAHIFVTNKTLRYSTASISNLASGNYRGNSSTVNSGIQNLYGDFKNENIIPSGSTGLFSFSIPANIANNINSNNANIQYQYRQITNTTNLIQRVSGKFNITWGVTISNETITDTSGLWTTFNKNNDIFVGFTERSDAVPNIPGTFLENMIAINRNGDVIYKFPVGNSTNLTYNTTSSVTLDSVMPRTAWITGNSLFFQAYSSNGIIVINVKTENMPYWLPLAPYGINNGKKYKYPLLPFTNSETALSQTAMYSTIIGRSLVQSTTHTDTLTRFVSFKTVPYYEENPLFFDRDTSIYTI